MAMAGSAGGAPVVDNGGPAQHEKDDASRRVQPDPDAKQDPAEEGKEGKGGEEKKQDNHEKGGKDGKTGKDGKDGGKKADKQPPGGFDDTPTPKLAPGFTVRFTFHRATQLPMADINSLSSDPFIVAELKTDLPTRHAEDPPLRFRTETRRRTTEPVWDSTWVVGHVPASGFRLKCRLYDEDPADHDDRLGNVTLAVPGISESWAGVREQAFKVKKRMGSKRAYLIRGCLAPFSRGMSLSGSLFLSAEVLGRSEGRGGRAFTVGPMHWTQHFSPMIGRLTGTKDPSDDNTEQYNFQANQFQLQGPVPQHLYHRYVEFKPFVKGMFSRSGFRGYLLNKALHHQHARVYNFDRATRYGSFESPSEATSLQFLDMVHYDQGGRIFTYVLTLDGHFRFTETGEEFGIDLLSKHTMHSDVSDYIAFSGEFMVRRLRDPEKGPTEAGQASHPPNDIEGGPPHGEAPHDAALYELIIDNDSGTYRPNGKYLPQLKAFMEGNFPGLKIRALACDDDELARMKEEQKENKEAEGDHRTYLQTSDAGSISSSDEEHLERRTGGDAMRRRKKKAKKALHLGGGPGGAAAAGAGGAGGKVEQGMRVVAEPGKVVKGWAQGDKEREKREEEGDAAAMKGKDKPAVEQTDAGAAAVAKQ